MRLRGLQQEVADLRSQTTGGARAAKLENSSGHDHMNWAEDFMAILRATRPSLPRALKWASDPPGGRARIRQR